MIEIVRTDENDADFLQLVAELDVELRVRDGEDHAFYAQYNKPIGLIGAVLALEDKVAVGCGAFKKHKDDEAEIKRMFVRAESRGRRIAAEILGELEKWALESGFAACVLETGMKQPEAIALYKRSGYEPIANYGQYAGVYNSVCLRKEII